MRIHVDAGDPVDLRQVWADQGLVRLLQDRPNAEVFPLRACQGIAWMLQDQMKPGDHSFPDQAPSALAGALGGFQERAETVPAALRVLASVFQREADAALFEHLEARSADLSKVFDADPLGGLDLGDREAATEVLAVEYCRLFIGPSGHMPPVESIVLGEGQFWGPSTEKVADFYKTMGIAVARDCRMVPDHISMELDCLAILEEKQQGEDAGAFAREHPLRWLPSLVDHVEERATLAFYPTWAKILHEMLCRLYAGKRL